MAPPAGECINALEAASEKLQEDIDELRKEQAAHQVANRKKFVMLEKSISNLDTKTQANIDALGTKTQASIDALAGMVQTLQASQAKDLAAIIALLTPRRQSTQLPTASSMPAMTSSLPTPKDPAQVALPASPSPASSPVAALVPVSL
jgi:hypothetical protein